jgi:RNA polymerase sigma factor (sigma-70 family)
MATEAQCAKVLELFETTFERVYRFARRSSDPETAEEVAQEVFSRLLSLQDFEKKELSVSYLIKIADNLLKRRHQRQQRWRRVESGLARETLPRLGAMGARDRSEVDESRVAAAMDRLSTDEREAVRLIVCEGLSYEDAARSLGVQVSTINNWKHRGIQKLKQHVGRDRAGEGSGSRPDPRRGRARQRTGPGGVARHDG